MQSVYTSVPAPWGRIHLAAGERGVVALELFSPTDAFVDGIERMLADRPLPIDQADGRLAAMGRDLAARVEKFLAGEGDAFSDIRVDLRTHSDWDRRVLDGVRQIPFGAVTSYGRLARIIGSPGAARAVGGAVGRNPIGLIVPCHRVIAGDGGIGGYGGEWWGSREDHLAVKRELLAREGISIPARTFVG